MVHHLNFKKKTRKLVFGSYQSTIYPVGNEVYAYTQGRIQGGGGALGAEAPPSYLGFT